MTLDQQPHLGSETRDEHATFMRFAGVQLERLLPGPLARVWDHLTKPGLLPAWFGENSSIEPRVGGTVRLMNGHVRGTVTQWSPPPLRCRHEQPGALARRPRYQRPAVAAPGQQRSNAQLTHTHVPAISRICVALRCATSCR
jgi:hypothetical protein